MDDEIKDATNKCERVYKRKAKKKGKSVINNLEL